MPVVLPSNAGKPLRDNQHNYCVRLLDKGLERVDSISVERTALGNVLQRAEKRAKERNTGLLTRLKPRPSLLAGPR
ncbi:hypothetical protein CCR75_002013 [Bremia lactucae]|uniref:Uncharacterized protein n=1 Tax=Bremia lactucae TaxID=4779 RepID=A0A976FHZ3_BRELC|nr:hypothetical protein CCR75_002013 [Bremia lactucae]